MAVPALRPEILAFYEAGRELQRLSSGRTAGPLEFARTTELIGRYLAPAPLDVLDVGGGPGRYAAWLAARGDRVLVVDPVPLHVQQARELAVGAELGDARELRHDDGSFDVVLLMGPLYHLIDAGDRARALVEARRVLKPGGLLVASAISRFSALLDLLVRLDRLHEPRVFEVVADAVDTGVFRGDPAGLFTTAFFHLPGQFGDEVTSAGFDGVEIFNVEGPGFLVADFDARWDDPARREAILAAARLIEDQPAMAGASSHLLAAAHSPQREPVEGDALTITRRT